MPMPPAPTPSGQPPLTQAPIPLIQTKKKKWLLPITVCVVVLIGAGTVFAVPTLRTFVFEKIVTIKDSSSVPSDDTDTPVTTTTATTTPDGKEISISLTVPSTIKKGSGMQIHWSVNNIPAGSSIGFFVVRNLPREEWSKHFGVTGALALKAENVDGSTRGVFNWNGQSVGCAPTDFPMFCKGVEPGEYLIKAVIYNQADAPLVIGFPPQNYRGPTIIADAQSAPFIVTGPYNLDSLKNNLTGAAVNKVQKTLVAYAFAGTHLEQYVKMRGDVSGPDANGIYCATFDLLPPVSGTLTSCGPNLYDPNAIIVSGDVQFAGDTLSYADAKKAAHKVSAPPYTSRVKFDHQPSMQEAGYTGAGYSDYLTGFYEWSKEYPDATTYLSTGVTNWVYRADGRYWLFIIFEIKAGGQENGPDRFADNVLVKVGNSSEACVVKTVGYHEALNVDIFKDTVRCP